MGKVLVSAKIENLNDRLNARGGRLKPDQVRSVNLSEAMVDTGSKLLGLPRRLIEQLGLDCYATRQATTTAGQVECNLYSAVWLTIDGRECSVDVAEVPDDCPALIGYVPLELLDYVVDVVGQRLIPDPKQGGQRLLDMY
jgi:predicted aspartyl protease